MQRIVTLTTSFMFFAVLSLRAAEEQTLPKAVNKIAVPTATKATPKGAESPAAPRSDTPTYATTSSRCSTCNCGRAINPAILDGVWQASRDDGSKLEMTLKNDATFNWNFTKKEMVQEFGGTYKLQGNVLALERKDGGSLVAGLVPDGPQKFNFKLLGSPKEDPGLNFSK